MAKTQNTTVETKKSNSQTVTKAKLANEAEKKGNWRKEA